MPLDELMTAFGYSERHAQCGGLKRLDDEPLP